MSRNKSNQELPRLRVSHAVANERIAKQIEIGSQFPNISINDHSEAYAWYKYTAHLLETLFTTSGPADEFTGRGSILISPDIRTGTYIQKLRSILQRVELYEQDLKDVEGNEQIQVDTINIVERISRRFHAVSRQLRDRYDARSTLDIGDEYDVQDLFHALLKLFFNDIRAEEWTPSYAGGSARMDFLLKPEQMVIEIKKTRIGLATKELRQQISIDIMHYSSHPDCKCLICFIYDPEDRVTNKEGFERDLSKPINGMDVQIFFSPKT